MSITIGTCRCGAPTLANSELCSACSDRAVVAEFTAWWARSSKWHRRAWRWAKRTLDAWGLL